MTGLAPTIVETWFGDDFARLDPLLQRLHSRGGSLVGPVAVRFGQGLAGWLGRRQAARMRLPVSHNATVPMRIDIHCDDERLHWSRTFEGSATMQSTFVPVGCYPNGYWIEHVGAVRIELGVDIVDGGWRRRPSRARLGALPVPMWLMPRITANKRVVGGRYRFVVATALPGLGTLLSYEGDLTPLPGHREPSVPRGMTRA